MVTTVDPDGALGPARRPLEDAVHALASPRPQWVSGAAHWEPALYDRLRTALHYGPSVERKARGRSTLAPCRTDLLTVLLDVDATVRTWTADVVKGGTVGRLAGRGWRPQDVATIERHCDDLQRWTIAATDLLVPSVRVFLPQPCPHCSARHAYRHTSSGEHLRSRG